MRNVVLRFRWNQLRPLCALAVLCMLAGLTGCPFFQCEGKTSCGTSSTSTGTGDYAYVSNSTEGSEYISAYTIGTDTLTALTDSPFSISFIPSALQVSANNSFLYAAATGTGGVYVFTITSTGALSDAVQLISATEVDAMTLSPDGAFLFILTPTAGGEAIAEYPLNATTGALGSGVTTVVVSSSLTDCTPVSTANDVCGIQVSPNDDSVVVAAGLQGSVVFTYSTGAGIPAAYTGTIAPASSSSADYSVAIDESGYAYITRTLPELTSYDSLSAASPTLVSNYAGYPAGSLPRAATFSISYNYLFTANPGVSDISAFNVSNGVATAFTTPTYVAPATVYALGVDRSGTYLLAAGYNTSNGLQLFTIASTGLTAVATQGTGSSTTVPAVLALTHS